MLRSQVDVPTTKMEGGKYYHFVLAKGLLFRLKCLTLPASLCTLKLQFNIDGLPLFKSSKVQFWLILALVNCDYNNEAFIVGLFCGISKPKSVFEYLRTFIIDLTQLLANGIICDSRKFEVIASSFVCDAPARAFVKNGYFGCDKCCQVGEWKNKMTCPETNVKKQTYADFDAMLDDEHHLCSDDSLCSHLLSLNVSPGHCQKLIAGKPQSYAHLLYTGPIVLRNSIPTKLILVHKTNFMLFSVGMSLLLTPGISYNMVDLAHKMLVSFVSHFGKLFGRLKIVFTIHQVIHLADEYKLFGPLDNVSSFPFENYLGQIKHLLREPHLPLQQVVKRIYEIPYMKCQCHMQSACYIAYILMAIPV